VDDLWIPLAGLALGLGLLAWGAERFVWGAAAGARALGVAPMVVGLVVVGFGTSAPELLVGAVAAWDGRTGLALGNAVGSNVANIGLILGAAALARPLAVRSEVLRRELPVPVAAMLTTLLLLADNALGRADAGLLLAGFLGLLVLTVRLGLQGRAAVPADPIADEFGAELPPAARLRRAGFWLVAGLVLLLVASRLLVWSAVEVAHWWGLSDLVIGLTVVAIGTSLPELAATVAAALKDQPDIAIGNVVGSNTFNTLAVIGVAGLVRPAPVDPVLLFRDFPVMVGLSLALFVMAYGFGGRPGRINRVEGALLLAAFAAYLALLLGVSPA
jgi:cation:H+ antiporter